jgi:hypothetical protein
MESEVQYSRYDYPAAVYDLFPLIFILYRPTKPQSRKKMVGVERVYNPKRFVKGWGLRKVYGKFKKKSTNGQNNYSFVSCLLMSPNDYGTMKRSLTNKGFTKVVGAVYPTPEEVTKEENNWRMVFRKYRTALEMYHTREVYLPEFKDICERIDERYISMCGGQLRLFRQYEPDHVRAKKEQKHVPFQKKAIAPTSQLGLFDDLATTAENDKTVLPNGLKKL